MYIRLNILNNKQKKKYMNKKNIMLNVVASRFSNIKEKKKYLIKQKIMLYGPQLSQ